MEAIALEETLADRLAEVKVETHGETLAEVNADGLVITVADSITELKVVTLGNTLGNVQA